MKLVVATPASPVDISVVFKLSEIPNKYAVEIKLHY